MQFSLVVGVLVGIFQTQTGGRFCDWNTSVIIDQHLSPQFPPLFRGLQQNLLIISRYRAEGAARAKRDIMLGEDKKRVQKHPKTNATSVSLQQIEPIGANGNCNRGSLLEEPPDWYPARDVAPCLSSGKPYLTLLPKVRAERHS